MNERDLQKIVTDYATSRGWRWIHHRPARTKDGWRTAYSGNGGFPDLVLVRGARLIFAELKAPYKKPTDEQAEWLTDLEAAGVEVYLWQPKHLDDIFEVLA